MPPKTLLTYALIETLCRLAEEGLSMAEIASRTGLYKNAPYNWIYKGSKPNALPVYQELARRFPPAREKGRAIVERKRRRRHLASITKSHAHRAHTTYKLNPERADIIVGALERGDHMTKAARSTGINQASVYHWWNLAKSGRGGLIGEFYERCMKAKARPLEERKADRRKACRLLGAYEVEMSMSGSVKKFCRRVGLPMEEAERWIEIGGWHGAVEPYLSYYRELKMMRFETEYLVEVGVIPRIPVLDLRAI